MHNYDFDECAELIACEMLSGGMTSEFVRQELRAVVGARTGASVGQAGGGGGGGARPPDILPPPPPDLDALALSFDMPPSGTFHYFITIYRCAHFA